MAGKKGVPKKRGTLEDRFKALQVQIDKKKQRDALRKTISDSRAALKKL